MVGRRMPRPIREIAVASIARLGPPAFPSPLAAAHRVRLPSLHLISRAGSALERALVAGLTSDFQTRHWRVFPHASALPTEDPMVIDLMDPVTELIGSALEGRLNAISVVLSNRWSSLVVGDAPIDPRWLQLAMDRNVEVFVCSPSKGVRCFNPIIGSIRGKYRCPDAQALVDLVVKAEPSLVVLARFVEGVVGHPWEVRYPKDLARVAGVGLAHLRMTCLRNGYRRIEHFITTVRSVAARVLVTNQAVPNHFAQYRVGIGDSSNFRRQLSRARPAGADGGTRA